MCVWVCVSVCVTLTQQQLQQTLREMEMILVPPTCTHTLLYILWIILVTWAKLPGNAVWLTHVIFAEKMCRLKTCSWEKKNVLLRPRVFSKVACLFRAFCFVKQTKYNNHICVTGSVGECVGWRQCPFVEPEAKETSGSPFPQIQQREVKWLQKSADLCFYMLFLFSLNGLVQHELWLSEQGQNHNVLPVPTVSFFTLTICRRTAFHLANVFFAPGRNRAKEVADRPLLSFSASLSLSLWVCSCWSLNALYLGRFLCLWRFPITGTQVPSPNSWRFPPKACCTQTCIQTRNTSGVWDLEPWI